MIRRLFIFIFSSFFPSENIRGSRREKAGVSLVVKRKIFVSTTDDVFLLPEKNAFFNL